MKPTVPNPAPDHDFDHLFSLYIILVTLIAAIAYGYYRLMLD